ncbi:PREDICTED: uncharacterized protein LOC104590388 isoform X2 [Nelumbo nucifera]|uniref:Uncharacterized protein LOC104590388 isoform X2 n=2 Tax=Nelumbo nucifera TaxID=4432 RepID=A0A1U7Z8K8_NELNU|nr:PREDICTED: uncharacterized protein LOC104590388 isoform X2 [Nelumbo nucifera]
MSRQESRENDTKRHHLKPDKESSPKRPRRDEKLASERTSSDRNLDIRSHTDWDQKRCRRLEDAIQLMSPLAPKLKGGAADNEFDKKTNGLHDGMNCSFNPTEVPLPHPRSYFQNEHGSAGQGGQSFSCRQIAERGWWRDPKEQFSYREEDKAGQYDNPHKDKNIQAKGEDKSVWHHNGSLYPEPEAPPQAKKRPTFREKKIPLDSRSGGITPANPVKPSNPEQRGDDKGRIGHRSHVADRHQKPFTGGKALPYKGEVQKSGLPPREKFNSCSGFRRTDRFSGRHGERNQYRHNTSRMEKWKHDLFDEANRSPTPKNEEQIAEVEALLTL